MTATMIEATTTNVRCRCEHFLADRRDYAELPAGVHFLRVKCPFCGKRYWYDLATNRQVDHPRPPAP